MSAEPLAVIWRCADVESPVFTGDEVGCWAPGVFTTLTGLGLLVEGKTASVVACDACAGGHAGEVMTVTYPDRQSRFFIRCGENGRVEVERSRLLQWSVRFDPICRFLSGELGIQATPEEVVPTRAWRIGRASLAGRPRAVWVARGLASDAAFASALPTGRSTVLFVLGRPPAPGLLKIDADAIVDLSQVVALAGGEFVLNRIAVEAQLSSSDDTVRRKPPIKRATRAAAIDALERILIDHIIAARDQAYAAERNGRSSNLLPRPAQKQLAAQLGLSKAAVSRAFSDRNAQKLRMLWEIANDPDRVKEYGRR